ncbi:MAG TPA: hypothetical protein PKW57_03985 [Anaerolineaceae bacterium]|jgi:hypothetical protein|nr:hypothetical protein [Anaerolineaceae bacterium]
MDQASVSERAINLYNKAMDLWKTGMAFSDLPKDTVEVMKGYLKLAIQYAGCPYLDAEENLAEVYLFSSENNLAMLHAKNAQQIEPNSFPAQFVRVMCIFDKVDFNKLRVGDFLSDFTGDWADTIISSTFKGIFSSLYAGAQVVRKTSLNDELGKMVSIFHKTASSITSPHYFQYLCDRMFLIADVLKHVKSKKAAEVYKCISDCPTTNLILDDSEKQEIEDVKIKAEALALIV